MPVSNNNQQPHMRPAPRSARLANSNTSAARRAANTRGQQQAQSAYARTAASQQRAGQGQVYGGTAQRAGQGQARAYRPSSYTQQAGSGASRRNAAGTERRASAAQHAARPAQAQKRVPVATIILIAAVLCAAVFGISRVFALFNNAGSAKTQQAATEESATANTTQAAAATDPGEIVLGLNGSAETYVLKGEEYLEAGAHAAELTDGILNSAIEVSGEVNTKKAGDYTVSYSVSDSTGHTATAERTVHVVESMDKQETGIPVLMYHYVYADDNPPSDLNENYISVSNLSAEFNYLKENNFYFPSYQEVSAFLQGEHSLPKNSIVLTFDDAEGSFLDNGIPVAEQYQIPITSFSIGMYDNEQWNEIHCASAYVSYQSHSYSMHQGGGSVGHGGLISALTKDEIVADLKKAQEQCGTTEAFAYPFGDVTEDGKAAVKEAGILCAFTTVNGWARIGDDCSELPRVRINGSVSLDSYINLVTTVQG